MPDPRFILVGHCIPDAYALRSAIQSAIPSATVEFANDETSLESRPGILLINRKLDGDFPSTDGLALLKRLSPSHRTMLISNLPGAQQEAQSAGALPGFGKSELYSSATRALLLAALES